MCRRTTDESIRETIDLIRRMADRSRLPGDSNHIDVWDCVVLLGEDGYAVIER